MDRQPFSLSTFMLLALVLHWWLKSLPTPFMVTPISLSTLKDSSPIEIDKWNGSKSIVQTERSTEEWDKQTAPFGGEFRNRTPNPTVAPRSGRFRSGGQGGKSEALLGESKKDEGDVARGKDWNELMPFAQTPNHLPIDIPEGDSTVLNTDPVIYASFINRIADEIYDRWVYYARESVEALRLQGTQLESGIYVTKIQIVIEADGTLSGIQVLRSSGTKLLDDAPKKAFWEAEPFSNPPRQLFEKDNLVRFIYEFHFSLNQSAFNIVPLI